MTLKLTTSWDDGHQLDLRVADLLDKYGLRGTFYIARHYLTQRMDDTTLRDLATRHEIGAHTINHPILTQIPLHEAQLEIQDSKAWLEDVLGHAVHSFCYPGGFHNTDLCQAVENAGYTLARITTGHQFTAGNNQFAVPTTLQVYPFPLRPLANVPFWRGWKTRLNPILDAKRAGYKFSDLRSLEALTEASLQRTLKAGGIWHLWGHSWEIEQYDLWADFENILFIASYFLKNGAQSISNNEIIDHA